MFTSRSNIRKKGTKKGQVVLNDEEVLLVTNSLKVLFNCTLAANPEESSDEELLSNLSELCRILHLLLTLNKERQDLRMAITRFVISTCKIVILFIDAFLEGISNKNQNACNPGKCLIIVFSIAGI